MRRTLVSYARSIQGRSATQHGEDPFGRPGPRFESIILRALIQKPMLQSIKLLTGQLGNSAYYISLFLFFLGQHKNADKSDEKELSARSASAVSSPKLLELNLMLQSLHGRYRLEMQVKSLQKRINQIYEEGIELDRRADEAISTYGNNVQVIMLFHGLGSIFLQLNHPYFGTSVSVLMVVSFFSEFIVAYIVHFNKIGKMSLLEKDLQRRQRELQNEITYFGADIKRIYSDEKLEILASNGALEEVLSWIGLLIRDAGALQSTITGLLELSSNSESNRMKSLFHVSAYAIIYGLSFPMMAYSLLYFGNFRKTGFVY